LQRKYTFRCSVLVKVEWVERELGFLHRSRMDIVANILREAVGGATKTRIMYRCNLSFRQLQAYLDLLLNTGLLRTIFEGEKGSNAAFQTTIKGRAFLQAYRNLKALLAT